MLYPHTHSLPSLHPPAKHCGIVSLQTPSVLPSGLLSQLRPLLQVLTLQKKKRRSTDNQRLAQGPVTGGQVQREKAGQLPAPDTGTETPALAEDRQNDP